MAVTGRQCGECTLCCKVFTVAELNKPAGRWCEHCSVGKGCNIYPDRPAACSGFNCSWLVTAWIGEDWKPSRSGLVLHTDPKLKRVLVRVDPDQPNAWQREPYHSQLRRWAAEWAPSKSSILVLLDDKVWVVLPDRDLYLGDIPEGETVVTQWTDTPTGPRLSAYRATARAGTPST